jgi:hypothetical protein
MKEDDRIIELLVRIEENQRRGLEAQQQHLQIAQAQLERSNKSIQESIGLQRAAVSRQAQITKIVIPLIAALVALLGYLLVRWHIIFL